MLYNVVSGIRLFVSCCFAGLCLYDGYLLTQEPNMSRWILLFAFFAFTSYGLFMTEYNVGSMEKK